LNDVPQRVISCKIPYKPRAVFIPFHKRTQRFAVGVAHRRCGKTVASVNGMLRQAICSSKENYRAAYIAPLLNQAKDTAWTYLKRYSEPLLARAPNESELWIELLNGARIRIYGADNPDRLRGGYFDDVILDEYADMAPTMWGEIIRPMLADRQGTATFIGTPKGRNGFWQIYQTALNDPDWFTFMLRASETGILPQSELDASRKDMTAEQYEQEFECSFEAAILGAYYGKEMQQAELEKRITNVAREPSLPVHTAWDLGIGDSTAIWAFQVLANEIRVLGAYENHSQPLSHYVAECEAREWKGGHDFVPQDAKVRSLDTGRTRVETLAKLGRKPELVPAHSFEDGINAARLTFPRIWFDKDSCANGLEALRQYRVDWDEKTRSFKNTPKHDWTSHAADAFRYLCMAWRYMLAKKEPKPSKPVFKTMVLTENLGVGVINEGVMTYDDLKAAQPSNERENRL
jgi:phage terminase large subunit